MAKIVVLGASGQLGTDLMSVFATKLHHQVIALDRHEIDGLSLDVLPQLTPYADVDYIINCIATTNVDGCEDSPQATFVLNSGFVVQLAQFCTTNKIKLIHISTDYVLDGTINAPYTEQAKANPLNMYGLSKYAAELAIDRYCPQAFILRVASLFGVAGAAGKGGNFVTTMLRLAVEKENWTVIDDQFTCPTHTLDIAKAIQALIEQNVTEYGVYNCVSSSSCSWFEFTQEILRQTGHNPAKVQPISYKNYNFKALRPQYGVLDVSKLAKYYQMPDYKTALSEYLKLKGLV